MPYVTIRLTGERVTKAQSESLISKTTAVLQEVLDKDPETTWVIIEEIPTQNWGIGGKPVTEKFFPTHSEEKQL